MTINSIEDFDKFMNTCGDILWSKAIDASDIPYDDEWIQDDVWDEDYKEGISDCE